MENLDNPLISRHFPIPFDRVEARHVVPAVEEAVQRAERTVGAIRETRTWSYDTVLAPLARAVAEVDRVMDPVEHLLNVANTPELRDAHEAALDRYVSFRSGLPLDAELWKRIRSYAETGEARSLKGIRRRHLEKTLLRFRRHGADLPARHKRRVREIQLELARLARRFEDNVLDATAAYELVIEDESRLAGLPESVRRQAREDARSAGREGWRFTLHAPSYTAFLRYGEERDLRRRLYEAHTTRATRGERNNHPLIERILALRRELSGLLGYPTFADLALEETMAGSGRAASAFEEDLVRRTRPHMDEDADRLEAKARELGLGELRPWDVSFVMERIRRDELAFDEEEIRPYLSFPAVLAGLFGLAETLFGVRIDEVENPRVWHAEVATYEVRDETGTLRGLFYTDWYPRDEKRGGAWMHGLLTPGSLDAAGRPVPATGLIAGNVSPPEGGRPALLRHREVETLFHEFGHLLHLVLTEVPIPELAGTNVAPDWVELPSQLLENWTWEPEALGRFARHWETGEPLPETLFRRLRATREFMAGWQQWRQLSFGTLDLELHFRRARTSGDRGGRAGLSGGGAVTSDREPGSPDRADDAASAPLPLREFMRDVLERFAPRPGFADDDFPAAFAHIFSGGYAASYYSYLWSEMLEADVFGRFREAGIFDRETGRAFARTVLARGDAADPADLFRELMGRDPDPEALFRRKFGRQAAGEPTAG